MSIHSSGLFTEIEMQQYRELWFWLHPWAVRWPGLREGRLPTLVESDRKARRRADVKKCYRKTRQVFPPAHICTQLEFREYQSLWRFLNPGRKWTGYTKGSLPAFTKEEKRLRKQAIYKRWYKENKDIAASNNAYFYAVNRSRLIRKKQEKRRSESQADQLFKLIITANAIGNIITDTGPGRPGSADTG